MGYVLSIQINYDNFLIIIFKINNQLYKNRKIVIFMILAYVQISIKQSYTLLILILFLGPTYYLINFSISI